MQIALINMPFASAKRPSLALGVLQSLAHRHGHSCCTKNFNTLFSRLMGTDPYRKIAEFFPVPLLAGEWIFSQAFYGEDISSWNRYEGEVLSHPFLKLPDEDRKLMKASLALIPEFLDLCFESCDWSQFRVVGFTSTFEQTMASMCLARLIKQRHPSITILMGGANFESEMSLPYLRMFPFIDYICHGEADVSFPQLCQSLADGDSNPAPPAGFLSQQSHELVHPHKLRDLDDLPFPDFDDYFRAIRHCGFDNAVIPVEAARGCWWGEKSHCTFCGLNGQSMKFRQKSAGRVLAETAYLTTRYQPRMLSFSDNILSRDHMKTVLPLWAADGAASDTPKFFEVKSNMTRDEVILLKQAGVVYIQPGIESLTDSTLRIMGKGVTSAHNIAVLRWCMEIGVTAYWNLLYGFPGEDPHSFAETAKLIEKLSHLNPPQGCFPIRVDRFSPNYERWQQHGFHSITPVKAYNHVFAASPEDIGQVAYFFDYEHAQSASLSELSAPMRDIWWHWLSRHQAGSGGEFTLVDGGDFGSTVSDSRFNRQATTWHLTPDETALLLACDQPVGRRRLAAHSLELLENLLRREIIVETGDKLITAVLMPQAVRDKIASSRPRPLLTEEARYSFQLIQ